jgi:phosphatidylserine/phosphatidylglycerophosphate/cardiolipin synthase-like enzyme
MRTWSLLLVLGACAQPASNTVTDAKGSGGDGGHTFKDAPGTGTDGSVVMGTSDVSIIVEPNGNHASELISAINAAHSSVYMTMYQIDNTSIVDALVSRKQAGLDVQAILDSSTTCKSWNTSAYNTLKSAGVAVVWSNPAFTYTHEKTVIIDGATAWIMTMNANSSPPSSNREYLAIDTDPTDVAEATAVFQADHAMMTPATNGNLVVANVNARPKLVALIDSAQHTLDIEVEELSDMNLYGVANAIAQTADRGVTVRVVLAAGTPSSSQQQAIAEIKQRGGKVVVTGPTSGGGSSSNPYIHAKAIVVDCVGGTCARGFVGSENLSGGSLGYNRELGVIFTSSTELEKVESAISTDFSRGTPQ